MIVLRDMMPKSEGWGREMGAEGLAAFTETKSVYLQLSERTHA